VYIEMEESVADLERQVVLLKRVLASFDDTDVFVALPEGPNGLGRSLECDISAELKYEWRGVFEFFFFFFLLLLSFVSLWLVFRPFFRRLFSSDVLESPNCNFGESTGDVTLEVIGLGDEIAHAIVFVETAPEENAPPGVVL
jgi:hypothetical protein